MRRSDSITCKFCGTPGLHWGYHGSLSRLFDSAGGLHSCNYKAPAPVRAKNPEDIRTILDLPGFTHWKVGDTMELHGEEFEIRYLAVLEEPTDKTCCRVLYFDVKGKCRGWQKMKLISPKNL